MFASTEPRTRPPVTSPALLVGRPGDLRRLIRDMRDAEGALRAALPDHAAQSHHPGHHLSHPMTGARIQAIGTNRRSRRFRRDRLPQAMLDDPKYWQTRPVHSIRVRPLGDCSAPIENAAQKEDIQLIEPWQGAGPTRIRTAPLRGRVSPPWPDWGPCCRLGRLKTGLRNQSIPACAGGSCGPCSPRTRAARPSHRASARFRPGKRCRETRSRRVGHRARAC